MKKNLLLICLVICLNKNVNAQSCFSWTNLSDYPGNPRFSYSGWALGSDIYICLGGESTPNNEVWKFTPPLNFIGDGTWFQLTPFPGTPRSGTLSFQCNGKGYIMGGSDASNNSLIETWEFTPSQSGGSWIQVDDFPGLPRVGGFVLSIANKGYIGAGVGYIDWWEYDRNRSPQWLQKPNLPSALQYRFGGINFESGGKGYVGMGNWGSGQVGNDLWEYDPAGNGGNGSFTQKANLQTFPDGGRFLSSSFAINSSAYVYSGISNGNYIDETWEYHIAQDSWSRRTDFPGGHREANRTFVIGNTAYTGLGYQSVNNTYLYKKDWWQFSQDNFTASAGVDQSICSGSCATLTTPIVSGVTYSWNNIPSSILLGNTNSISVCPASNSCYQLIATNSSGCSDTDTVCVFVNSLSADITVTNVLCNGGVGGFTILPSGGTAGYTAVVSPCPVLESPCTYSFGSGGVSVTDYPVGTFNVTVNDANGCTTTIIQSINYTPLLPVANCKNLIIILDSTGQKMISPAEVDSGSTAECGIASMSVNPNQFTISDTGIVTLTLSVTDFDGNISTCQSLSTVISPNVTAVPTTEICGFDFIRRQLAQNSPIIFRQIDSTQNVFRSNINDITHNRNNTNYTIPVVVHVIHKNNEAEGVGSNISYEQIQSQIDALNAAFNKDYINYNKQLHGQYAVNTGIKFCLAEIPRTSVYNGEWAGGNTQCGVMRYPVDQNDPIHKFNGIAEENSLLNLTHNNFIHNYSNREFPFDMYLNIWLVSEICFANCQYSGYATMYQGHATPLDGIVFRADNFGDNTIYGNNYTLESHSTQGKILAHEVGHYLGLFHTQNSYPSIAIECVGINSATCKIEGDFCCDTPPTKDLGYHGGAIPSSCGVPSQVENYMSYSDDLYMNTFTNDQSNLMTKTLDNFRPNISSNSNLDLTGVLNSSNPDKCACCKLDADFSADNFTICPGEEVNFFIPTSASLCATSWSWNFGVIHSPVTRSVPDSPNPPTIFFDCNTVPGIYPVSLTVSANGIPPYTITKNVTVLSCIADFTVDKASICPGDYIHFNIPNKGLCGTSWTWTFEGGTPATITKISPTPPNPTEVYYDCNTPPGNYNVSLTASDGVNPPVTKNQTIAVGVLAANIIDHSDMGLTDKICEGSYQWIEVSFDCSPGPYTVIFIDNNTSILSQPITNITMNPAKLYVPVTQASYSFSIFSVSNGICSGQGTGNATFTNEIVQCCENQFSNSYFENGDNCYLQPSTTQIANCHESGANSYYVHHKIIAEINSFPPLNNSLKIDAPDTLLKATPVPHNEIWCQSVFLNAGEKYSIQYFACGDPNTKLHLKIDGIMRGSIGSPSENSWNIKTFTWTNSVTGYHTICICQTTLTKSYGYDFFLGNISIRKISTHCCKPNAGPDQTICLGSCINLTTPSVAGTTYKWYKLPGLVLIGSTSTISNICPTDNTCYLLQTIDALNCRGSDTICVTVQKPFSINGSSSKCVGDCTKLNASGLTSYSWTSNPTDPSLLGQSTLSNPLVCPLVTTTYSLAGTNICGNTGGSVTILVYPNPQLIVTHTDVACEGACTGRITAKGAPGSLCGFPEYYSTFRALNGITNTQPCALITSTSNDGTEDYLDFVGVGDYEVTLTDCHNCKAKETVSVISNSSLIPTVQIESINVPCIGSCLGFIKVTGSGGTPFTGFQKYISSIVLLPIVNADSISPPICTIFPQSSEDGTYETYSRLGVGTYIIILRDANGCRVETTVNIIVDPALSPKVNLVVTDYCIENCAGTIKAYGSGGTPIDQYAPYASFITAVPPVSNCVTQSGTSDPSMIPPYSIFFRLGPGEYVVTLSDSEGCSATASVTLYPPIAISLVKTNVTCFGLCDGTITVIASGGAPCPLTLLNPCDYNIQISPIGCNPSNQFCNAFSTGYGPGTYIVTVSDCMGCTATASVTIYEYPQITISATHTDALCNGGSGSITVNSTGGLTRCSDALYPKFKIITGPSGYSYPIPDADGTSDHTFSDLDEGCYTVQATDCNNCTTTTSVCIGQDPPVFSGTYISSNVSCPGGHDGSITIITGGGTPCPRIPVTLLGNPFAYSISPAPFNGIFVHDFFYLNGNNEGNIFTGLTSGTYTITVTDCNGCTFTLEAIITEPLVPVELNPASFTCSTFPDYTFSNFSIYSLNGSFEKPSNYPIPMNCFQSSSKSLSVYPGTFMPDLIWKVVSRNCNNCCGLDGNCYIESPIQLIQTLAPAGNPPHGKRFIYVPSLGNVSHLGVSAKYSVDMRCEQKIKVCLDAAVWNRNLNCLRIIPAPTNWGQGLFEIVFFAKKSDGSCTSFGTRRITEEEPIFQINDGGPYYDWELVNWQKHYAEMILPTGTIQVIIKIFNVDASNGLLFDNLQIFQSSCPITSGSLASYNVCTNTAGFNTSQTENLSWGTGLNYLWSNGATTSTIENLTAGSYYVTVTDDDGDTYQDSVVVPNYIGLTLTPIVIPVSSFGGNDGSINLTVSGGTPPYNYLWSNNAITQNISGLTASTYSVSVTDANGCAQTQSIVVTENNSMVSLNLNLLIHGYYTGGGLMQNAGAGTLFVDGVIGADETDADTLFIGAMNPVPPYGLIEEQAGILQTNGNISVNFGSNVVNGDAYFLRVRHRNSVETWSSNPVILSSTTSYAFTSAPTQVFGNNEIETFDNMGWAIYSGDINQDGAVDGSDFLLLDPSIQNGDGGYVIGDLNGDGAVDASDFLVLDPNIQNGIGTVTP